MLIVLNLHVKFSILYFYYFEIFRSMLVSRFVYSFVFMYVYMFVCLHVLDHNFRARILIYFPITLSLVRIEPDQNR